MCIFTIKGKCLQFLEEPLRFQDMYISNFPATDSKYKAIEILEIKKKSSNFNFRIFSNLFDPISNYLVYYGPILKTVFTREDFDVFTR